MRPVLMAAASLLALGGSGQLLAQAVAQPSPAGRDSFVQALDRERSTSAGRTLPSADRFAWGDLSIPAGTSVEGPVAAAHGTVHVRGQVDGDVFAFGGDIVVHSGGEVIGSARAVQGRVILEGGLVRGAMRASSPLSRAPSVAAPLTGAAAVQHALKLTAAWFTVVLLVGLGVIMFSGPQLEAVVQTLEHRFTAAFFLGIAGQLGMLPALVLVCVALALTLVGVLLIPFAIVAFVLAVAGLITLGALAATTVVGYALVREGSNVRLRAIRSMMLGALFLVLPWIASALLANTEWAEMLARMVAVALTWVATTAGFGAALIARGGVRRVQLRVAVAEVEAAGWQTPTPIGGIVAARRPTATPSAPTSG